MHMSSTMKILILCFINLSYVFANFNNEIKMIASLIKSFENPATILGNVCWKSQEKAKLVSYLGNETNMMRFIDKLPPEDYVRREQLMFVVDSNCPRSRDFFIKANATKKFALPYRWVVIGRSLQECSSVPSELQDLDLLPDSQVIVSQNNGSDYFKVHMIYRFKPKSEWIIEDYGQWSPSTGLKLKQEGSIATRRKNFNEESIKTVLVILDNKTMDNLHDLDNVDNDLAIKAGYLQLEPLYTFLNGTRKLVYTNTWGYKRNGTWDGMMAALVNGEAEIAGTIQFTTQERLEAGDYLVCPTLTSIKFLFREPPLSYQNNLFLLPFKTTVWYCIGVFVIVLILILYVNAVWEKNKTKKLDYTDPTALEPNISDSTLLLITAVTQQGSTLELKGTLGRVVMFLLFFSFLIIFSAYCASIVALLQSTSSQIRTLSDLLNSKMALGAEDTPYSRYYFSTATEPVRKAIYQTKIAPRNSKPNFMSLDEGVKKMQKEAFAFNVNKNLGYRLVEKYFHEHEKCGLQEIAFLLDLKTYYVCRKNSPYREIFKVGLLRLQEHGFFNRINRLAFGKKPPCISRGGSFRPVYMIDFYPVLLMFLYGMILACAFLLLEVLVHRKLLLCKSSNNFQP